MTVAWFNTDAIDPNCMCTHSAFHTTPIARSIRQLRRSMLFKIRWRYPVHHERNG